MSLPSCRGFESIGPGRRITQVTSPGPASVHLVANSPPQAVIGGRNLWSKTVARRLDRDPQPLRRRHHRIQSHRQRRPPHLWTSPTSSNSTPPRSSRSLPNDGTIHRSTTRNQRINHRPRRRHHSVLNRPRCAGATAAVALAGERICGRAIFAIADVGVELSARSAAPRSALAFTSRRCSR